MSGSNVTLYSTTAGNNATIGSITWAEGQAPSTVNDSARLVLADIRSFVNVLASGWIEYGDSDGSYTATYVAATQFKFSGVDLTSVYHVGRRIRLVAATPGTIYGTITASAFATDTTLTISWDSGSLSNEAITSVMVSPVTVTNSNEPSASETVAGRIELATQAEVDTGTDTARAITPATLRGLGASLITGAQVAIATDSTRGSVEFAVQSEMETGTSNVLAVTPGRQHFHPGHPKFWILVTIAGGTPSNAASYNVTSITDSGAGITDITIATDFSGTTWGCIQTMNEDTTATQLVHVYSSLHAAGTVRITSRSNGALTDFARWTVAGYGDQA